MATLSYLDFKHTKLEFAQDREIILGNIYSYENLKEEIEFYYSKCENHLYFIRGSEEIRRKLVNSGAIDYIEKRLSEVDDQKDLNSYFSLYGTYA